MLFIDFGNAAIGLHVNGRASVLDGEGWVPARELPREITDALSQRGGRRPQHWVRVDVVEAYMHCSKHIPHLVRHPDSRQAWGTDDPVSKGGDYFGVKHLPRPWVEAPAAPPGSDRG